MTTTVHSPESTPAAPPAQRRKRRLSLSSTSSLLSPLVFLVAVGLVWDLCVRAEVISAYLLPPPMAVLDETVDLFVEAFTGGAASTHFFVTLNEIVVGFLIAVVIGTVLGTLMSEFTAVSRAIYPYVIALNSTPKIAIAPLMIAWFGFGQTPKIVLVVAIATFPVIVNTMAGLQATDSQTLRLMDSLGASRWQTFLKVRVRNALPFFFAGLELAVMTASIGAVVGEFTGGNQGLGYVAVLAQEALNVERTFAVVALLAVQGIVLHRIIILVRNRIIHWEGHGS